MMVKVCGITDPVDALAAAELGASALGFNFCSRSPRYLAPERAAEIDTPGVLRVGIFVAGSRDEIDRIAAISRLDVAQIYDSTIARAMPALWRAYRVTPGWTLPAEAAGADAILLDSPAPGSGTPFDWSVARGVGTRLILAGGLDGDNVRAAIEAVRPWGVDACSRLESAPGKKDRNKMARFIRAARQ